MTHYISGLGQIPDNIEFFISIESHQDGYFSMSNFRDRLHFTLDKPNESEKFNLFSDLMKESDVDAICTKHVRATRQVIEEVLVLYLIAFNDAENDKKSLVNKLLCLTVGNKLLEFITNLMKLELIELSIALSKWIVYMSYRSIALIEKIEDDLRKICTV